MNINTTPNMTIELSVLGVGLLGPGMNDWASGQALLGDSRQWLSATTVVPPPARLPATERRRAGIGVKASVVVADQAVAQSGLDPATLATVFTSSTADTHNCHLMCEALAMEPRTVSPTRFTNSVHNAPSGYWHIAAQSRAPSTSLAALDASWCAGLLEAAVQCQSTKQPVLLVAFDQPYPQPMHTLRPVPDVFATALLLGPPGTGRRMQLTLAADADPTVCDHAGLEALRQGNPAARALPLLQALARQGAASLVLDAPGGPALKVDLS